MSGSRAPKLDWISRTANLTPDDVLLIGVRGYHLMGREGNDRGIYDDALIWVRKSTGFVATYDANVDPTGYRKGKGFGATKGMASLKNGIWRYKPGPHRGKPAFRQAADVIVIRDGDPPYENKGQFGINIHPGSQSGSTSSLGCQTLPVKSWADFKATGDKLLELSRQTTFPYILIGRGDIL